MSVYYDGDIEKDLDAINSRPAEQSCLIELDLIGKHIGYGRAQQILQVLWAANLEKQGLPKSGALFR